MVAATALDASLALLPSRHVASRGFGVLLVSILPALFWAEALKAGALSLGVPLSARAIGFFGFSVMLFLAAVCAPLMLRNEPAA